MILSIESEPIQADMANGRPLPAGLFKLPENTQIPRFTIDARFLGNYLSPYARDTGLWRIREPTVTHHQLGTDTAAEG
jgi:hypothetical protein